MPRLLISLILRAGAGRVGAGDSVFIAKTFSSDMGSDAQRRYFFADTELPESVQVFKRIANFFDRYLQPAQERQRNK